MPASVAAPAPAFIDSLPADTAAAEPWADLHVPQAGVPGKTGNAELQFQEHARTVGSGPDAVQLRRLTPEERESRRRRRNFVMLLTGGTILVAIAIRYGVSTGVKRRR